MRRMPLGETSHRAIEVARDALLAHFDEHRRELPWRRTHDPYAIWVSEVMLQQTRVETVVPYYTRFLARFPTPRALADAPLEQVLTMWSGLGYYRRARMLHAGAHTVIARHDGIVPRDFAQLKALPGVGRYTAGAIASIAFGVRAAAVDGNVERVLSRWLALRGDPHATVNRERLWRVASDFADCARAGDVNQALMDVGATICTPHTAACDRCPLGDACRARRLPDPTRLPEKTPRKAIPIERWNAVVVLASRAHVLLETTTTSRWQGMLLPWLHKRTNERDAASWLRSLRIGPARACGSVTHVLTHARMVISVYRARASRTHARGESVEIASVDARAIPKVTRLVLAQAGVTLP